MHDVLDVRDILLGEFAERRESGYEVGEFHKRVEDALERGCSDEEHWRLLALLEKVSRQPDWPLRALRSTRDSDLFAASFADADSVPRRGGAARPDTGGLAGPMRGVQPREAGRGLEPRGDPRLPRGSGRVPARRLLPKAGAHARRVRDASLLDRDRAGERPLHDPRRRHRLHDPLSAHPGNLWD